MDRNLAIELVRVSEFAALAASKHIGRGNEKAADQAAVDAMRKCLNSLTISGTVVIGEGERDEAPMLYIGEKVGQGGPNVDIALDPLEGTTITAKGGENAMAVIALAQEGGFLNAPDVYMRKISAKVENESVISLSQDLKSNIKALADYKKINTEDLQYIRSITLNPRDKFLKECQKKDKSIKSEYDLNEKDKKKYDMLNREIKFDGSDWNWSGDTIDEILKERKKKKSETAN